MSRTIQFFIPNIKQRTEIMLASQKVARILEPLSHEQQACVLATYCAIFEQKSEIDMVEGLLQKREELEELQRGNK